MDTRYIFYKFSRKNVHLLGNASLERINGPILSHCTPTVLHFYSYFFYVRNVGLQSLYLTSFNVDNNYFYGLIISLPVTGKKRFTMSVTMSYTMSQNYW